MTTTAGEHAVTGASPARRTAADRTRSLLANAAGTLFALALLPIFPLFDVSLVAWAIGAALIAGNRLLHLLVTWGVRDSSITVVLGAMGFSMLGRALLSALVLFFVGAEVEGASGDTPFGMGRPDIARPAIIVFLLGFTIDAGIEVIRRAGERLDPIDAAATSRETTA